ncbi:MAG TPA: methylmalonyl-CoA mutase, partial [Polynucleobacter sp.]|nr:methylmalonyl-CoA mutase [Polynucleobacter sp.]
NQVLELAFTLADGKEVDVLMIDNDKVREGQIARLNEIKAKRDTQKVQAALEALTKAAEDDSGNLLELSVNAIRLRATVGEVSDALEKVYGRHRA